MTDQEFDEFFAKLSLEDLFYKLGTMVSSVQLKNGRSYAISRGDDLKAVVDQELYEIMTGRE